MIDWSKEGTFKNITLKSFSKGQDICSPSLCNIWVKEVVWKGSFQKNLKDADVTPVFKKDNPLLAKNVKPVT